MNSRRNFLKFTTLALMVNAAKANYDETDIKAGEKILHPMERLGEDEGGNWKNISWSEAFKKIAKKIFNSKTTMISSENEVAQNFRKEINAVEINTVSIDSELSLGATIAYGDANIGCEYEFLYTVNTIVLWGIDNSIHSDFIKKAKRSGAKIIVIAPIFNNSYAFADLWIPLKFGSDNILAMSIMNIILNDNLYKADFMKTFTDLPFLVNVKTKKLYLKNGDFYVWNINTNAPAIMRGTQNSKNKTLRLEEFNINPALEGTFQIEENDEIIKLTTVYEFFKKNVSKFTPQNTQKITNVHPNILKIVAHDIAKSKVTQILASNSLNKEFNSLMTLWNLSSICGITGRMGRYGGLSTSNKLFNAHRTDNNRLSSGFISNYVFNNGSKVFDKYFTDEDIKRSQNGMSKFEHKQITNAMIKDGKDGQKSFVKPWYDFDVAIVSKSKNLFKNTKFLVCIEANINESTIYADIILPANSKYEEGEIFHLISNELTHLTNKKYILNDKKIENKHRLTSPIYSDLPYTSFENTLYKYKPLHTLSGRQTFYIDHALYIRLGANTNNGVPALIEKSEKYPFKMITIKNKSSTTPFVSINPISAKNKNIQDGDKIRIFNMLGEFHIIAKFSSLIPVDILILEQSFANKLAPIALNLLEMVDGWGHLKFSEVCDGNVHSNETAVNIEKVELPND